MHKSIVHDTQSHTHTHFSLSLSLTHTRTHKHSSLSVTHTHTLTSFSLSHAHYEQPKGKVLSFQRRKNTLSTLDHRFVSCPCNDSRILNIFWILSVLSTDTLHSFGYYPYFQANLMQFSYHKKTFFSWSQKKISERNPRSANK